MAEPSGDEVAEPLGDDIAESRSTTADDRRLDETAAQESNAEIVPTDVAAGAEQMRVVDHSPARRAGEPNAVSDTEPGAPQPMNRDSR